MTENRWPDALVILFVKAPGRGRVKSRLAAEIGDTAALDLYRNFVHDTVGMLQASGFPFVVSFHPPGAQPALAEWLGPGHRYLAQEGGDLGQRMERSFERVFAEGAGRAILIGSDIPDLPPAVIRQAFEALDRSEVVLGPARDGGYYLIGFRKQTFVPALFRGIPWSGPTVFRLTMDLLDAANRRVHLLPPWNDVDTLGDLQGLRERNRDTAFRDSRTMHYLRSLHTLSFKEKGG